MCYYTLLTNPAELTVFTGRGRRMGLPAGAGELPRETYLSMDFLNLMVTNLGCGNALQGLWIRMRFPDRGQGTGSD